MYDNQIHTVNTPALTCTHCGATNHYPDHCPFILNPLPGITGGQWVTTREDSLAQGQMLQLTQVTFQGLQPLFLPP